MVTSSTTDPHEELENYICSIKESAENSSTALVRPEFEPLRPQFNKSTALNSRLQNLSPVNSEQLIVYSAPVIQEQISSRCKQTSERLKEIKKEKSTLITTVTKTSSKPQQQQHDDPQQ